MLGAFVIPMTDAKKSLRNVINHRNFVSFSIQKNNHRLLHANFILLLGGNILFSLGNYSCGKFESKKNHVSQLIDKPKKSRRCIELGQGPCKDTLSVVSP